MENVVPHPRQPSGFRLHELTDLILASYYAAYNTLGSKFPENVHRNALVIELNLRGLSTQVERPFTIEYKGHVVGSYRADLIVEGRVMVECKVVDRIIGAHKAQLLNYLRATGIEVGLLLNFGVDPSVSRLDKPSDGHRFAQKRTALQEQQET